MTVRKADKERFDRIFEAHPDAKSRMELFTEMVDSYDVRHMPLVRETGTILDMLQRRASTICGRPLSRNAALLRICAMLDPETLTPAALKALARTAAEMDAVLLEHSS